MRFPLLIALTLVGCSDVKAASRESVPVLGDASAVVLRAIRAAETGNKANFAAELAATQVGIISMNSVNLRPECELRQVTQHSSILVIATWACGSDKRGAHTERGFMMDKGKIAAITGPAVPEYHITTEDEAR